jgi:hypothetical protein
MRSEEESRVTWEHIYRPTAASRRGAACLATEPRYSSIEAVCEPVAWLIEQGIVKTR